LRLRDEVEATVVSDELPNAVPIVRVEERDVLLQSLASAGIRGFVGLGVTV
jgi:hypothetical protein